MAKNGIFLSIQWVKSENVVDRGNKQNEFGCLFLVRIVDLEGYWDWILTTSLM